MSRETPGQIKQVHVHNCMVLIMQLQFYLQLVEWNLPFQNPGSTTAAQKPFTIHRLDVLTLVIHVACIIKITIHSCAVNPKLRGYIPCSIATFSNCMLNQLIKMHCYESHLSATGYDIILANNSVPLNFPPDFSDNNNCMA